MWKQELFKIFAQLLSFQSYQWPVAEKLREPDQTRSKTESCCAAPCCA
jgi:hypothetical protein